jgi:putative protein-disulfide isomerase
MPRLVYFADPMCSWCYGFGPQLDALLEREPSYEVVLVMGGLRPYNRKVADAPFKEMLRGHWKHVRELSGLAISETILERDDFVYDTEFACRAVVTFRGRQPKGALAYFTDVQRAFYRDGLDVTQAELLADIAVRHGMERAVFLRGWESEEARQGTKTDFETTHSVGVTGFPTIAIEHDGGLHAIAAGYTPAAEMSARAARVRAGQPVA